MPTEEQMEQVRKWLLWAMTQAEIELGSGTHKLKLSMVYDLFVQRFPWLARNISFSKFSKLVDKVLEELNGMIVTNEKVKDIIYGDAIKTKSEGDD
jgi:hypothetical protein